MRIPYLLGCFAVGWLLISVSTAQERDPQVPFHKFELLVPDGSRSNLLEAVRHFGEVRGFAVRIAPTAPGNRDFLVQMYRDDIKIIGTNSGQSGLGFYFGVFQNGPELPPKVAVDDLVVAFDKTLREVPAVSFRTTGR